MRLRRIGSLFVIGLLVSILATPVPAYAWIGDEDQTDLSDEEIAEALADGSIDLSGLESDDGAAAYSARGSYALTTLGGQTRYDTSAQEALSAYSRANTVIIAGGEVYADSIAGASLAGVLDAPLLLTDPKGVTEVTANAIKTLGASKAIILGGTDAVSKNAESQIKALVGANNVERLQGKTRYETQMQIYKYGADHKLWTGNTAIVATGKNFPDALAVSPVAFALKAPVFFIGDDNALPSNQFGELKASGMTKFLLVGGGTVAPDSVRAKLDQLGQVTRLGGETRYETAKAVNDYAVSNLGFSWDGVAFASGISPWDSLGGGVMQGKAKRALALVDNNGPKTEPYVLVNGSPRITFLGGKDVYSNAFKAQVAYKLGYKVTDIQGFRVYIDAGHGWDSSGTGNGWDSGAVGNGYQEANLTQELADKVAWVLRYKYGVDTYVNKRGWYKYRQAQASALDCGLLLSIHFNADGGQGSESYIHTQNAAWGSKRLQHSVTPKLADAVGRGNRGEKDKWLAVVSGKLPATLIEVCFIDNRGDMQAYLPKKDSVAFAIADGIVNS